MDGYNMKALLLCQDASFSSKLVQKRNFSDAEFCDFDTVQKLSEDDKCLNGMFVAEASIISLKSVKKGPHKGWVRLLLSDLDVLTDDDKETENYYKVLSLNKKGKPELLMSIDDMPTSCVVTRRLQESFLVLPVSPVKLKGLLNKTTKTVVLESLDVAIKGGFKYEENDANDKDDEDLSTCL